MKAVAKVRPADVNMNSVLGILKLQTEIVRTAQSAKAKLRIVHAVTKRLERELSDVGVTMLDGVGGG